MKALTNSKNCPNCGDNHKSRPFCIYENGWHCFSCGYTKTGDRSFTETSDKIINSTKLPEGCTNDFNKFSYEALLWLAKYNINSEDIRKNKILYYGEDNSLIFLNVYNNELVGWQKRNMIERYITTEGEKRPLLLKADNRATELQKLVIVEDYISGLRVSYSYDALILWGTKISYRELMDYFSMYDKVALWLDNDYEKKDNSGQIAATKILEIAKYCISRWNNKRGFTVNCKEIVNILTNDDPKTYTDTQIRSFIEEAFYGE